MKLIADAEPLAVAALKSGMDPKTARKYQRAGCLPSALQAAHTWRTRPDPFEAVWTELQTLLETNPGLQAKSLLAELQRRYPGQFADAQLRTLQRKVKVWRALEGPTKAVIFPQVHRPGELGASDFCHLTELGVTIAGQPLAHLLYHFVLTYSNWETGCICFAESFESLSAGLQAALWELGGVPQRHRTDSLSAAVQPPQRPQEFTQSYRALLAHYGLQGEHIQVGQAHENGDVEQRHYRFKVALDQALMLRGSRNFENREEYADFVHALLVQLNAGRQSALQEERAALRALPATRFDARKQLRVKVGPSSTIRVLHNVYSVSSRLIGEWLDVRLGVEDVELWYGQHLIERLPRLRGESRHRIHYRHIIDQLVRKPGAFASYRYRDDLFPSSHFRMAYDALQVQSAAVTATTRADKEYLAILHLAARESEQGVEDALRLLLAAGEPLSVAVVESLLRSGQQAPPVTEVRVAPIDLCSYDGLLEWPWTGDPEAATQSAATPAPPGYDGEPAARLAQSVLAQPPEVR